jgi:hypothetical protein
VSDNASENTTVYNNVSRFGSDYFEGLTQTPATVVSGAVTAEDVDELENCVLNNSSYYHNLNAQWFLISLSSNALYFDSTSPVTDTSLIAVLEASVKKTLFYFRSLSVLVVSDTQNQPLMTRAEASTLTDEHLLMWDALNNKAKDSGISKSDIQSIIANIFLTAHPVGSLFWTNDPTDPSVTYGGTWRRIKDKFVYAMGDNDTVDTTHGNDTVKLSVANMPSHYHSTNIGSTTGSISGGLTTYAKNYTGETRPDGSRVSADDALEANIYPGYAGGPYFSHGDIANGNGTNGIYPPSAGKFASADGHAGVVARNNGYNDMVGAYAGASGGLNGVDHYHFGFNHFHEVVGSVTVNFGTKNTDSKGSGTAFSIMPPYICKYCWERTA